ncbi:hypothetical protein BHE74_00042558 [Ensete ventricosum]|nr:hypothetical protein BHE74_00042558 [Ensete ventricosum]
MTSRSLRTLASTGDGGPEDAPKEPTSGSHRLASPDPGEETTLTLLDESKEVISTCSKKLPTEGTLTPAPINSQAPIRSDQFPSSCSVGSAPAPISSRAPARSDQFPSSCSVGSAFAPISSLAPARSDQLPLQSVFEPLLGRINSRSNQFPSPCLVGSIPELLLGRFSSRSNQFTSPCSVRSIPELLLDWISSRSNQFPSPCSVESIPELLLGRINSRFNQFSSPCSVGSAPAPISSRAPARPTSSSPELRSVRSVPEPLLRTSPTSPRAIDSTQDLIFNTLIRHLEKVFQGGKNDMTNVDMTATSSHPRTTGLLTWSTRRGKSIWRSSSPQRSTIALTSLLLQLAVRFSLLANAAVLSLLLSMAFNSSVLANAVVTCLRHSRAASLVFDRAGERVTMK